MSWFTKLIGTEVTLASLRDVLILQLEDLYSTEEQLIDALPNMAQAAHDSDLREAFHDHLEQTRRQKERLDEAFQMLGIERRAETCEAMKGLISESDEIIGLTGEPSAKDAALIAAAQRIEHYEMAGYGCARTFAMRLGQTAVAELLQDSLDEESDANDLLTDIAEMEINDEAVHHAPL